MITLVCRNVECSWDHWEILPDETLCPTHYRRDCPNCHGTVLLITLSQWRELEDDADLERLYKWLRKENHEY